MAFTPGVSRLAVAIGILLAPTAVLAATLDAPSLPYEDLGGCLYECCAHGKKWTATRAATVRSAPRLDAAVAFTVRPGERLTGLNSAVITHRPGLIHVKKRVEVPLGGQTVSLPQGERLYALHPVGEGLFFVWHRGQTFSLDVPPGPHADPTRPPSETPEFRTDSDPEMDWWLALENSRGEVGWSDEPEKFDDIELCD